LPANFTMSLAPATSIGCVVQNNKGEPIPNVHVEVWIPAKNHVSYLLSSNQKTDSEGRWRCDSVPADLDGISFNFSQKGYAAKNLHGRFGKTPVLPIEQLRNHTAVITLQESLKFAMRVVGGANATITNGAVPTISDDTALSDETVTIGIIKNTNSPGEFVGIFDEENRGKQAILVAKAPGRALSIKEINLPPDNTPVEFTLGPARTITGRVVDEGQNPIARAYVRTSKWGRYTFRERRSGWFTYTDPNGCFSWREAPEDELDFVVGHEKYMWNHINMSPSGKEYTITLKPAIRITGTVTDAETGKPVEQFRLIPTNSYARGFGLYAERLDAKLYRNGQFEFSRRKPYNGQRIAVEVDGYAIALSEPINAQEGEVSLRFRLRKANPDDLLKLPSYIEQQDAEAFLSKYMQDVQIDNRVGQSPTLQGYTPPMAQAQKGVEREAGPPGRWGLLFKGRGEYLEVPASEKLRLEAPFTVEMWVQVYVLNDRPKHMEELGLISKGYYTGTGTGQADVKGFGIKIYRTVEKPEKLFYTCDESGGKVKGILSIDTGTYPIKKGVSRWIRVVHRFAGQNYLPATDQALVIGKYTLIPMADPFRGIIGEVRLWKGNRSRAEIEKHKKTALTGREENLIACWDFEQSDGEYAYDKSPNHFHARLGSTAGRDYDDPQWIQLTAGERINPSARKVLSAHNMKELGFGLHLYKEDNDGKFPSNWEFKPYMRNKQNIFRWVLKNVEYTGKGKKYTKESANKTAVAYDKTLLKEAHGTNVLFMDSHVEWVSTDDLGRHGIEFKRVGQSPTLQGENKSKFVATLPNGATVELVGVCEHPSKGKQWWRPDGVALDTGYCKLAKDYVETPENYQHYCFAARLSGQEDVNVSWNIPGGNETRFAHHPEDTAGKKQTNIEAFFAALPQDRKTTVVSLGIAAIPWETISTIKENQGVSIGFHKAGEYTIEQPIEHPGGRSSDVKMVHSFDRHKYAIRIVAVTKSGSMLTSSVNSTGGQHLTTMYHRYPIPLKQIKEFRLQLRPYNWVEFQNVSLKPNFKTDVQVEGVVDEKGGLRTHPTAIDDSIGRINLPAGTEGSVTAEHGDAIYGSDLKYSSLMYLGRVGKGQKIELVHNQVHYNEFSIPIIKVKVISKLYACVPIETTGWVTLADTDFAKAFEQKAEEQLPQHLQELKKERRRKIVALARSRDKYIHRLKNISPTKPNSKTDVQVDGEFIIGGVVNQNGGIITGAEVGIGLKQQPMMIGGSKGHSRNKCDYASTDKAGIFRIPKPETKDYMIVVSHNEGYARIMGSDFTEGSDIVVQPWGRIEGKFIDRVKTGSTDKINIRRRPWPGWPGHYYDFQNSTYVSGSEGKFVFERVMDGWVDIGNYFQFRGPSGTYTNRVGIEVLSNRTTHVILGGGGRPVIGKFKPPEDYPSKIDYRYGMRLINTARPDIEKPDGYNQFTEKEKREWDKKYYQTDEYKTMMAKHRQKQRYYAFNIEDDGSFRIESVMPGKYRFHGDIEENFSIHKKTVVISCIDSIEPFEVPSSDDGSYKPYDLGEITLRMQTSLHIGDNVPGNNVAKEEIAEKVSKTKHSRLYKWLIKKTEGQTHFIDFDTGKMTTHVDGVDLDDEEAVKKWVRKKGYDAIVKFGDHSRQRLIGYNTALIAGAASSEEWKYMSGVYIDELLRQKQLDRVPYHNGQKRYRKYAIRTREGAVGWLRMAAIDDKSMLCEFSKMDEEYINRELREFREKNITKLSFHILVNKDAVGERTPMMSEEQIADYRMQLRTRGPAYSATRNDVFRWLKADHPRCVLPSEAVVEERSGMRYVLVCNRRPRAMPAGDKYPENWCMTKVEVVKDAAGRPAIRFKLDEVGAEGMAAITCRSHIGLSMAIVLGKVIAAPRIELQLKKQGMIVGSFSEERIRKIADILKKSPQYKANTNTQVEGVGDEKAGLRTHSTNTNLPQNIIEQRNKLLSEADTKIRSGISKLAEKFPQLKKAKRWERVISKKSGSGRIGIIFHHTHIGKVKTMKEPIPEKEQFGLLVVIQSPPKKPTQLAMGTLYPDLGLVGQVGTTAGNPELDTALKKLVDEALEPLKNPAFALDVQNVSSLQGIVEQLYSNDQVAIEIKLLEVSSNFPANINPDKDSCIDNVQVDYILRTTQALQNSRLYLSPHVTIFNGDQADISFGDLRFLLTPTISEDKRYVWLDMDFSLGKTITSDNKVIPIININKTQVKIPDEGTFVWDCHLPTTKTDEATSDILPLVKKGNTLLIMVKPKIIPNKPATAVNVPDYSELKEAIRTKY